MSFPHVSVIHDEVEKKEKQWQQTKQSIDWSKKAVLSVQALNKEKVALKADEIQEFYQNNASEKNLGEIGSGHAGFAMAKTLNAPFAVFRSSGNREKLNEVFMGKLADNGLLVVTGHGGSVSHIAGSYTFFSPENGGTNIVQRKPKEIVDLTMESGLKSGDHVNILLSICEGAKGVNDSFAHKLAQEFAKEGISTVIIASEVTIKRFGTNAIHNDGTLNYSKIANIDVEHLCVFTTQVDGKNPTAQTDIYKPHEIIQLTKQGIIFTKSQKSILKKQLEESDCYLEINTNMATQFLKLDGKNREAIIHKGDKPNTFVCSFRDKNKVEHIEIHVTDEAYITGDYDNKLSSSSVANLVQDLKNYGVTSLLKSSEFRNRDLKISNYYADLDRAGAEQFLKKSIVKDGEGIIRKGREPNTFVFSRRNGNEVEHTMIYVRDKGYQLGEGGPICSSVIDLIKTINQSMGLQSALQIGQVKQREFNNMLEKSSYHVNIDNAKAERFLFECGKDGEGVIHKGGQPNTFVCSFRDKDKVNHTLIEVFDDGYIIENSPTCATPEVLVQQINDMGSLSLLKNSECKSRIYLGEFEKSNYNLDLDRDETELFLSENGKEGEGIIRKGSEPNTLVCSYYNQGRVDHTKIKISDEGYKISVANNEYTCPTFDNLVKLTGKSILTYSEYTSREELSASKKM